MCTGLVRTVNTNSGEGPVIVRVVMRLNVARGDTVGFARDGQIPVAGDVDTFVGVHWVIVYRLEGRIGGVFRDEGPVETSGRRVVVVYFWGSHVVGTFQGSNVGLPEFSFSCDWFVSPYHVQVLF